jgi:mannose-6-phosphate isomerase-like protein (cupin superfamily)
MSPEALTEHRVFRVEPRPLKRAKEVDILAITDLIGAIVHFVDEGGENNLHHHPADDAYWIVLHGEATFYGDGNAELATLGPGGIILIPRGVKYWFKKSGTEQAVVARIWATLPNTESKRVEFAAASETIKELVGAGGAGAEA